MPSDHTRTSLHIIPLLLYTSNLELVHNILLKMGDVPMSKVVASKTFLSGEGEGFRV